MVHQRVYAYLVVLGVFVGACRGTDTKNDSRDASAIRFTTHRCIDREGTGIEAFHFLKPADWTFDGGIRWRLDNPGMPAVSSFRVFNPSGTQELEVFPNQSFFWTTNRMLLANFPPGSRYFGAEVRQPSEALDVLKRIVLPRFRQSVRGLRIAGGRPVPELAQMLGAGQSQPGVRVSASGATLRIEYERKGMVIEEELYGVVESFSFPILTMFGTVTNTMWTAGYLFSFKAEKGTLDANAKLFQTIVSSFRVSPQWFSRYNQVVEYLIRQQIQRIHSVGELSRIISRTHSEISASMMEAYTERQEVYDRLSENFSRHTRGVDEYYNPVDQKPVELPAGYNDAWCNALGEYIVSENPNFNPNEQSNQTWHRMEKK